MDKSLNIIDIATILQRPVNFVNYKDLDDYHDIDDLLVLNNEVVILFPTSNSYGHWVALFKRKDGNYEFFDSYGKEMDTQLQYIKDYYREVGEHLFPHLTYLVLKSGKKLHYNNHHLQSAGSATCGRHVAWRLKNKNMNIDNYYKKFFKNKGNNDKIVYNLTNKYD